jgi:hypothetical protein
MTSMRDADRQPRLDRKSLAIVCQLSSLGLLLSLVSIFGPATGASAIAFGLAAALAVVVSVGLGFALAAAAVAAPPRSSLPW